MVNFKQTNILHQFGILNIFSIHVTGEWILEGFNNDGIHQRLVGNSSDIMDWIVPIGCLFG